MATKERQSETRVPDDKRTEREMLYVRAAVHSVVLAMKNYGLYPPEHSMTIKMLEDVKKNLDSFLAEYGTLRLDVEKDRLIYRNETIYEKEGKGESLSFLFYRDGIQWIEFLDGLELEELALFFRLVSEYKVLRQEPEGDLVTALWEADLPHIGYQATNPLWDNSPMLDFPRLNQPLKDLTEGLRRTPRDEQRQEFSEDSEDKRGLTLAADLSSLDPKLWRLTREEEIALALTVKDEDEGDSMDDVLDVLMIILKEQTEQQDFAILLEFILDEIREALTRQKFYSVCRLIQKLQATYLAAPADSSWASPLVKQFLQKVSAPSKLDVLRKVLPDLEKDNAGLERDFLRFLTLLQPRAISALLPMSLEIYSPRLKKRIIEVVELLADKDIRPLERLIEETDDAVAQLAVRVVGRLKGDKPTRLLFATRNHPSSRVRREVVKGLLERDSGMLEQVRSFLEDPSEVVRMQLLSYMGRRRDEQAEKILLEHIEKGRAQRKNTRDVLACFRALGRCGSSKSIPFLREVLLSKGWFSVLGIDRPEYREGAVIALKALGTDEAGAILAKASRSRYPGIRAACEKVLQSPVGKENSGK